MRGKGGKDGPGAQGEDRETGIGTKTGKELILVDSTDDYIH